MQGCHADLVQRITTIDVTSNTIRDFQGLARFKNVQRIYFDHNLVQSMKGFGEALNPHFLGIEERGFESSFLGLSLNPHFLGPCEALNPQTTGVIERANGKCIVFNEGFFFEVDWVGGRAASMSWAELEANEFEIPDDTKKIENVFSFWEALPENY